MTAIVIGAANLIVLCMLGIALRTNLRLLRLSQGVIDSKQVAIAAQKGALAKQAEVIAAQEELIAALKRALENRSALSMRLNGVAVEENREP